MEGGTGAGRRHIAMVVQYDGTDYAGFQRQPGVPTIQAELERALSQLLREPVEITAAGRTDAGVHALGQVIAFWTANPIPVEKLPRAVNGLLPLAISAVEAVEVPPDFHPRFDARGKLYTYRILNRPVPSPFICRYAWHVEEKLDVDAMRQAAQHLIGRHDFSAFCASGSSFKNKVRTLRRLDISTDNDVIEMRFEADAFLYMMVRIIVGTLVEVGLGKRQPNELAAILQSRDRRQAGRTAPPQGLCLVKVWY